MEYFIGCAGWTIPRDQQGRFPTVGSHLQRYSATFSCVEINSSFYRPHRPSTYSRWADSTPAHFRFAVKIPKAITHTLRLTDAEEPLARFLSEVKHLGSRLGPLLVQLPPSLTFDSTIAAAFFKLLRGSYGGLAACEPRHPTWFSHEADSLLNAYNIARVAADPAIVPETADFGGARCFRYFRLHGTPRVYHSAYSEEYLATLAQRLRRAADSCPTWCIFDNTAEGHATRNAIKLLERLVPAVTYRSVEYDD